MTETQKLRHHAALTDRMARALGIDLEAAMMARAVPPGWPADAVLACCTCAHPQSCAAWLAGRKARRGDPDKAQAAPPYCRNAEVFYRLAGEVA